MQSIDELIDDFINELSVVKGQNFHNMYESSLQRDNLKIYLDNMSNQQPEFLIVGEAAGYKGCGRTGIPFTDEVTLTWLSDNFSDWFHCRVLSNPPTKEQSAQIIWEILKQNDSNGTPKFNRVLMWNAFPFHPYEGGNEDSNRSPTEAELQIGKIFLMKLIDMFSAPQHQIKIYALGNIAAKTISKIINLPLSSISKIRHPAHGGKTKCQNGLNDMFN